MCAFPFAPASDKSKSDILRVCKAETDRQWRKLIMIPSESICHPAAAEVLSSDLGNIYAEGLPDPILCHDPRESASDEERFQSWQTRLEDKRFYKGTVGANRIELIAQRRIAEVFAALPGSPSANEIRVNVQPLSGAAANLAVYEALLRPGERMMGLDLAHGGHLTHGSRFNFSGKTYEVHSYGIDEKTRKLNYDQIRRQAVEARPKIIIGGASSYPWDFDWAALRKIADEVGAFLLADIAHLAGLIAAGILQNPVPHAHAITFTTHKTLCGPRGAVIMSTDPEIGRQLDTAVFPGMQGGPHMNSIAAIGRLFEAIQEDPDGFRAFQRRVVDNARLFAERLVAEGFGLEYGGTDTHMLLVDLKSLPVHGETPLDGETASRLLEIGGIVCNKNVLPGDPDAAHASGLRFGLPWLTQRGVTAEQLGEIAKIVKLVLKDVRTFAVWSPQGEERGRGRVPPGVLMQAERRSLAIADALPYPPPSVRVSETAMLNRIGNRVARLVRGDKVRLALGQMLTARLPVDGTPVRANMLDAGGNVIDHVIVAELPPAGREERWLLLPHESKTSAVRQWIKELSDGYLLFDPADLHQKVDGPSVMEDFDPARIPKRLLDCIRQLAGEPVCDPTKPFFIGQRTLAAKTSDKARYQYQAPELPLRKTVLNRWHHEAGAKMSPFAGWEMPIQYPAGIMAEHRAVRTAAGIFDVSHMSATEVSGPHALEFLDTLLANSVSRLDPGEAQYTCILYPDGTAVDDLYLYRLERQKFMIVSNASNTERVRDWIAAVNSRRFAIDNDMPDKEADGPVHIRDLRNAGEDSRVGLALQGPLSLSLLQRLTPNAAERAALGRLQMNGFAHATIGGIRCLVARTGYTGEKLGFEIYVHPQEAEEFWTTILETGKPLGVLPAGLGARDSTRVEAGLPLFGHELEGDLGLPLTEAGYGFVVRFHVPFFIGRSAYMGRVRRSRRHVIRLQGQGRKTLRAGHVILDEFGKAVGQVTSFAYAHGDMTYYVLACVAESFRPAPGQKVRGVRLTADKFTGQAEEQAVVELTALTRFPDECERNGWAARYV